MNENHILAGDLPSPIPALSLSERDIGRKVVIANPAPATVADAVVCIVVQDNSEPDKFQINELNSGEEPTAITSVWFVEIDDDNSDLTADPPVIAYKVDLDAVPVPAST